ncbi:hypothetical protein VTO73DRAFT_5061 [Trametes versicolor]
MAQAAVPPSNDIMSTTSLSKSSAGRTPAANGHYVNGSAATSDASSERIQIIDDEKQFTPALTSQIEKWGLGHAGFDYDIVSVFGSQSTGKSTLLNRLFGTNFDVMDETKRQQTTKGACTVV